MKPNLIKMTDTHEDVVNIDLDISVPNHIPFDALQRFYDGGIHRPKGKVGQGPGNRTTIGHEMLVNIGVFGQKSLSKTWFEGGVFVGAHRYDCYDVLGMHLENDGQEFVICGVESANGNRPKPSLVRNFTKMTDMKIPIASYSDTGRAHKWGNTIAANLPLVNNSWGDAPGCEQIVYVGSGPSLRTSWEGLKHLDRSKTQIWCCNEAFGWLVKHGISPDYFFCIDATSPDRWVDGIDCSKTCLVTTPFANPSIVKQTWKDVLWFNIAGDGYYYNLIRKAAPHLFEIDATKGVGSAMIESSWFKGVKTLAMMACDFCYLPDRDNNQVWTHVERLMELEDYKKMIAQHAHYVVKNMSGEYTTSYRHLITEAAAVFAAAQCLWEQGVTVINATEGGCLYLNEKAGYLVKQQEKRGSKILQHKTLRDTILGLNKG